MKVWPHILNLNLNLLIDIPVKGFSMTIYKDLKIYEIYN